MLEIPDPLIQEAVHAIDAGDVKALEHLLEAHPSLVRDRLDYAGDNHWYFGRPYLLGFIAENPIRNGKLPTQIVAVTRLLLATAARESPENFREQIEYALGLVCSGRVPRECGVQIELIDLLVDAGADPGSALVSALAHRENAAAERLLQRGAELTLLAAVCTGRTDEARRLAQTADPRELQVALAGAVLHRQTQMMFMLIESSVDVNAYNPSGLHAHGTALHHAVDSGSLGMVKTLVKAGADPSKKDLLYQGTPLDWAEHLKRPEIAEYLRSLKDEDINN